MNEPPVNVRTARENTDTAPETARRGPSRTALALVAGLAGLALLLYGRLFWIDLVMLLLLPFGTELSAPGMFPLWAGATALGGVLLLAASRVWRAGRTRCVRCGRRHPASTVGRADPFPWWAYVATYAAVAGATVRFARLVERWTAGEVRLSGIGDPFLVFVVGLALAGSLLPLALALRWGRIWPRWVLPVAGRPVPRWLVLGPAIAVGAGMAAYFGSALPMLLTGDPAVNGAGAEVWGYTIWAVGLLVGAVSYGRSTRCSAPEATDGPNVRTDDARSWTGALLVSYLAALVATIWWVVPDSYPYGADQSVRAGLNALLERPAGCLLLFASGALGLLIASLGIGLERSTSPNGGRAPSGVRRFVLIGAGTQAFFFAWVLADMGVLSTTGYLIALTAPIALVVLLIVLVRRRRTAIPALLALVALAGLGGFLVASGTLADYLGSLGGGLAEFGGRVVWSWAMAIAAAVWAWAAIRPVVRLVRTMAHARDTDAGTASDGAPAWTASTARTAPTAWPAWARLGSVRRWGRVATVVAALCPVPYGIARLSWLTPWHLLTGECDPATGRVEVVWVSSGTDIEPAILLQGVLFVGPVVAAVLSTLGLICRWGEVFPRWIPVYGGRPVPIALAVVPGAIGAGTLLVAVPGLVLGPLQAGDPNALAMGLVFMPLPLWGPALALAVLAYALRRAQSGPVVPA